MFYLKFTGFPLDSGAAMIYSEVTYDSAANCYSQRVNMLFSNSWLFWNEKEKQIVKSLFEMHNAKMSQKRSVKNIYQ